MGGNPVKEKMTRGEVPLGTMVFEFSSSGIGRLAAWGYPVLVGASRKRFIGQLTGAGEPAQRRDGSVGAAVAAYERGASVLRVHDVGPTRKALDVAAAIRAAGLVCA